MKLVPNHLDAQLIASCSQYLKLGRLLDGLIVLPAGEDVGHGRVAKVLQELETVETHVVNLRARSFQGFQAKAQIAEWSDREISTSMTTLLGTTELHGQS